METNRTLLAERLIAWMQMIMGMSLIVLLTIDIYNTYGNLLARMGQRWTSGIVFNLIMQAHGILIFCICLVSAGYFLLRQKRTGWMLTIVTTLLTFCIAGYYFVTSSERMAASNSDMITQVIFVVVALLSIAIFFVMLSNPTRERYQPTIIHVVIITIVTAAIVAEQIAWYFSFNGEY